MRGRTAAGSAPAPRIPLKMERDNRETPARTHVTGRDLSVLPPGAYERALPLSYGRIARRDSNPRPRAP